MTYGELQEGQNYGLLLEVATGNEFSADRRDYWYVDPNEEIDPSLVLVRRVVSFEVISRTKHQRWPAWSSSPQFERLATQ